MLSSAEVLELAAKVLSKEEDLLHIPRGAIETLWFVCVFFWGVCVFFCSRMRTSCALSAAQYVPLSNRLATD